MSEALRRSLFERLITVRSLRGFVSEFMRPLMIGQKALLYNPKFPRLLTISFNDYVCFYRCRICPFSLKEVREKYMKKELMELDTLTNLVKEVPNDPFYGFDISAFGETLLFDSLAAYIRYMKREKPLVPVTLSTNGVLLSRQRMMQLKWSRLDNLQISLFANDAERYKLICGSNRFFDDVCENIERAVKVRGSGKKPQIQVFILGINEFVPDFDDFIERWSGVVDVAFIRPVYNACLELDGITQLIERVPKYRYPCVMPWYCASINAQGDVGACYFHSFYKERIVGNVNERPLSEIWRGDGMEKFRQMHLDQNWHRDSLCHKCDLWKAYTDIWDIDFATFYFRLKLSDLWRRADVGHGA